MRNIVLELKQLTDAQLRQRVMALARGERAATAALLAHLAEYDARRLYLPDGYPSLFAWCTGRLHLSEHEAYLRIEAARASRRFPTILDRLEEGSVHLTAVSLLAPHLTEGNHDELLRAARHRTKRQVEELIAVLVQPAAPPAKRARVVPLPAAPRPTSSANAGRLTPAPLPLFGAAAAPESEPELDPQPAPDAEPTYRLHVTIPKRTLDRLEYARDLLAHQLPGGDTASILDRALSLLVESLERRKFAAL